MHTAVVQSLAVAHDRPAAQGAQAGPPQSTSVSVPFATPSLQPGSAHTPDEQNDVVQSSPVRHALPTPHAEHVPPPQSMAVSAPFFTPSAQVLA